MEIHLKELIAAFFLTISYGFGNERSYANGLVEKQLIPFLPFLTEITIAASPCPTISLLYLDVLKCVEPTKVEPFLLQAAAHWAIGGDLHFWNELGIGHCVCIIADKAQISLSASKWLEIADVIAEARVSAGEALKQKVRGAY